MRILFVCTGNTCRSPMAERMARALYPGCEWESAGIYPQGTMHPGTAAVLQEEGCDTTAFSGRAVDDIDLSAYDHIVLIGGTAQACCPEPPTRVEVHHWDVADPYEVSGPPEQVHAAYRACWDDLSRRIAALVAELDG